MRNKGFIKQETVGKVKDALVNKSKETVLKPTVKTPPASRQTTFKDFTQKYQPNVQGPKRSELQVQADNILNTIRAKAKRKSISRAQLDSMNIPQKEKDKLIRQGLVNEDNKHRDAKLNYQYKDVTNPKKPVDPIKALKLKKA